MSGTAHAIAHKAAQMFEGFAAEGGLKSLHFAGPHGHTSIANDGVNALKDIAKLAIVAATADIVVKGGLHPENGAKAALQHNH